MGMQVSYMRELAADFAFSLDTLGPVPHGAVASATPVRGDHLTPLVGGVHGHRPTHGIVVVAVAPGVSQLLQGSRPFLGLLVLWPTL